MSRQTYTLAILEVSREAYDEIAQKLLEADFEHVFFEDVLDMTHIGLRVKDDEGWPQRIISRVVHLKKDPYDVYIGRTHGQTRNDGWGNPFVIGPDGTREQVIEKYRAWILAPEQTELRARARRELKGKTLGCWCAPLPCHGDVLVEVANSAPED